MIGEQEAAAQAVNVRPYQEVEGTIKGSMSLADFEAAIKEKIATKWHAEKCLTPDKA